MSIHPIGRPVLFTAALFAWTLLAVPAAAAPAPPDKDAAAQPAQNPREGLERTVTLRLDKQSVGAAVAQIRDMTKLNIVLDAAAITSQLGSPPDGTPVATQADLKNVKVRAALRTLLGPYNLMFVVIGDSIVITTEDAATARQLGQRVSLHLDKVEFAAALKQLARETGVNLALDPRVEKEASAKVSLDADDVPLEAAVRLLAEMAGLKPVRAANTLFVTKKDIAAEMRADADLNPPPPKTYMDNERDYVYATRVWQAQGQFIRAAPAFTGPISVATPIQVNPPDPNPPPVPEKKDGDK